MSVEIAVGLITLAVVMAALLVSIYQLTIQLEERRQRKEREKPQVSVQVLKVWQAGSGPRGAEVGLIVVVENRSSESDALRALSVEFDDRAWSLPIAEGHLAPKSYETSDEGPAAPRPLSPGLPEKFRFQFNTEPLLVSETDRLPATFVADCSNAGEIRQDLAVYP